MWAQYFLFYCLNLNVTSPNVFKYQSCLGNSRDLVALKIKAKNRGKNFVNGSGVIPTLLIDDLNLEVCDLIHLDIEGYELFALQGAIKTIKKSPLRNPTTREEIKELKFINEGPRIYHIFGNYVLVNYISEKEIEIKLQADFYMYTRLRTL